MIQVNGKSIALTKQLEMTPKQAFKYSLLDGHKRNAYLFSLLGLTKTRVSGVNSLTKVSGQDVLGLKSTGTILERFKRLLDNSSDAVHTPLTRSKTSRWVGIEIECLIPRTSLDGSVNDSDDSDESNETCESCGGSGTVDCSNCDGSGRVDLEDSNGNDYTVRCGTCDGEGNYECHNCEGSGYSNGSRHSNGTNPHETLRTKLRAANITHCSVKDDGSLRPGTGNVGIEVTLLLDTQHGYSKLNNLCSILNSLGATVNDSCGLHVHLDQANRETSESIAIGKKFSKYLPVMSQLVPVSRRSNQYCRLSVSKLRGERYHAVNMTALEKHSTIEVRLHSGTTNATKIVNWISLLHAIETCTVKSAAPVSTVEGLSRSLRLSQELTSYFQTRFTKFNPETPNFTQDLVVNDHETAGIENNPVNAVAV